MAPVRYPTVNPPSVRGVCPEIAELDWLRIVVGLARATATASE